MELNEVVEKLLEIIYPHKCVSCGASGQIICEQCLAGIPPSVDTLIYVRSRLAYSCETTRLLLRKFKFNGRHSMHKYLGQLLGEMLLEDISEFAEFGNLGTLVVIPIPMSKIEIRNRGYNQAELLAKSVSSYCHFDFEPNILSKPKETMSQVRMGARERRLKNIKGAYVVNNPSLIANRDVILIDDVYTTGATIMEATSVLESAGAKSVRAYTLAH